MGFPGLEIKTTLLKHDLPDDEYFNCIFKRLFFEIVLKCEIRPSLYKIFNKFKENLSFGKKIDFLRTLDAFFNCVSKLQQVDIILNVIFCVQEWSRTTDLRIFSPSL